MTVISIYTTAASVAILLYVPSEPSHRVETSSAFGAPFGCPMNGRAIISLTRINGPRTTCSIACACATAMHSKPKIDLHPPDKGERKIQLDCTASLPGAWYTPL